MTDYYQEAYGREAQVTHKCQLSVARLSNLNIDSKITSMLAHKSGCLQNSLVR